ncbi:dihydrodipicolinate synthase family protein [Dactylosporangium sp. CA-233914]|uniref:dihydrodipicolinate synthase family protein n=1 Tax=Dactylosporangium sp. CA-233914 TaxID=3239934 RepID=UPI003D8C002A
MSEVPNFEGIIPAIVTPFTADGTAVNDDVLRQVVRFQLDAGVGGLIPCGSTGEFFSLTHDERKHVVETVVAETNGAVPVLPHTGALTTKETVELSRHAEQAGAAAVMVIPPFYEPNTFPELLAHYRAISDAISIPIVYYHMPSASGHPLSREQFEQLAEIENVRFTKDSSAEPLPFAEISLEMAGRLTPINGEDKLVFAAFAEGARATVWGSATFFPGLAVELYDTLVVKQSLGDARAVWRRIWSVLQALRGVSYQSAVKAGCELVGLPVGSPRLPIAPAPKEYYSQLAAVLRAAGVEVVTEA